MLLLRLLGEGGRPAFVCSTHQSCARSDETDYISVFCITFASVVAACLARVSMQIAPHSL